jgi:transcriptional regulator with XRE-family HTH domain
LKSIYTEALHEQLKALREERGIKKQETVARDAGIELSAYRYFEQGAREPGLVDLVKLASYFNVSIDYLLKLSIYRNEDELFRLMDSKYTSLEITDEGKKLLSEFRIFVYEKYRKPKKEAKAKKDQIEKEEYEEYQKDLEERSKIEWRLIHGDRITVAKTRREAQEILDKGEPSGNLLILESDYKHWQSYNEWPNYFIIGEDKRYIPIEPDDL